MSFQQATGLQLLQSAYDGDEAKGTSIPLIKDKGSALTVMNTDATNQETVNAKPLTINKSPAKALGGSQPNVSAQDDDTSFVDDLTETDLRLLLQSFKDLPLDEQHGLIRYLKKLEATDPVRVEKLRKYVNLGSGNDPAPSKTVIPQEKLQALAKVGQSGRLSPFSSRQQSRNPTQSEPKKPEKLTLDSDSDDDYSFDDVCKAAKQKISEQEAVEAEKKKAIEKVEKEKQRVAQEEMNKRLQEEKAKAEQRLKELEDREREQQRVVKEKERLEREAALKVGAANWNPLGSNSAPGSGLGSLVPSIPPPAIPPPPVPPTAPPPMQNMYGNGYGDVSAMGGYNGGSAYYPSNSYNQYQPSDNNYDQQSSYYQGQQNSIGGMYQQQGFPQAYSSYNNNNAMYQQPPPQQPPPQHQGYPVTPYGRQYY